MPRRQRKRSVKSFCTYSLCMHVDNAMEFCLYMDCPKGAGTPTIEKLRADGLLMKDDSINREASPLALRNYLGMLTMGAAQRLGIPIRHDDAAIAEYGGHLDEWLIRARRKADSARAVPHYELLMLLAEHNALIEPECANIPPVPLKVLMGEMRKAGREMHETTGDRIGEHLVRRRVDILGASERLYGLAPADFALVLEVCRDVDAKYQRYFER